MGFQHLRFDIYGSDGIVFSFHAGSDGCPCLFVLVDILLVFELDRFHHLTQITVPHNHNQGSVFIGNIKSFHRKLVQFLKICGSQNHHFVVSVPAAFDGLEVVSLCRQDSSQTGTASYNVNNDCRKLRTSHVRNPFLL
jgi:hypothetical protein